MNDDTLKIDPNAGLTIKAGQYTFYEPPPVVGYWVFPGSRKGSETKFGMTGRPNWFHRNTMRLAFGFKWEDKK